MEKLLFFGIRFRLIHKRKFNNILKHLKWVGSKKRQHYQILEPITRIKS